MTEPSPTECYDFLPDSFAIGISAFLLLAKEHIQVLASKLYCIAQLKAVVMLKVMRRT